MNDKFVKMGSCNRVRKACRRHTQLSWLVWALIGARHHKSSCTAWGERNGSHLEGRQWRMEEEGDDDRGNTHIGG